MWFWTISLGRLARLLGVTSCRDNWRNDIFYGMGTWGTAVFSDDTACDVRGSYVDFLGDGLSGPEATKKLLGEWSKSLEDPDEAPVFWLALAATQWKHGRLEPHVLQQALNAIDGGSDLARWDVNSKDYKKLVLCLTNFGHN
jgi:hypothetical protein